MTGRHGHSLPVLFIMGIIKRVVGRISEGSEGEGEAEGCPPSTLRTR